VADSREMLLAMLAHPDVQQHPDRSTWSERIRNLKQTRLQRQALETARPTPPIHPYQAVAALVDSIDTDTTVVADGAETYHWLNEVIRQSRPGSSITPGFLGAVGFGMGLALGAQTADPSRRVLCLVGDGAFGFTMAELDTMARHRLPIVVVIMNNRSWAASQH